MTKKPRRLALDLGTKTGYALAEDDIIIQTGVRDFSVKYTELKGKRGIMFYNFLMSFGEVDEIFYEEIQFGSGSYKDKTGAWRQGASKDHHQFYHGLLMLVEMYAAANGVHPIGVHPATLKKAFTGYGKAEKHDMCQAAHILGWKGGAVGTAECDDEADAIALLVTQCRAHCNFTPRFPNIDLFSD